MWWCCIKSFASVIVVPTSTEVSTSYEIYIQYRSYESTCQECISSKVTNVIVLLCVIQTKFFKLFLTNILCWYIHSFGLNRSANKLHGRFNAECIEQILQNGIQFIDAFFANNNRSFLLFVEKFGTVVFQVITSERPASKEHLVVPIIHVLDTKIHIPAW